MVSLKQRAVETFSRLRFKGRIEHIAADGQSIPVQIFKNGVKGHGSDRVVLFVHGFDAWPLTVGPGVLRQASREAGADFARFMHPDQLRGLKNLRYPRMIKELATVIEALPHERIEIAATSFGAGYLPHVLNTLSAKDRNRVKSIFAWSAVPPRALCDLFARQAGWPAFAARQTEVLTIYSPTMPKPFNMSRVQADGVLALSETADTKPFAGRVLLLTGAHDPVGRPEFTHQLATQLASPRSAIEVVEAGHRMPADQLFRGLTRVLRNAP